MITTALNIIAISVYLLAAALQARHLLNKGPQPQQRTLLGLGVMAVLAHGLSAFSGVYNDQQVDLSFFAMSSLIFWFIAAISLISIIRRATNTLLIVVFPFASLSIITSTLSAPTNMVETSIHLGLLSHILSSILAYSLMTLAAIQAVTLALQEHHIKHRHISGILQTLPPLETMEQILFELIWIGMGLLSISLVSGVLFIDDFFAQHLVHKTFFSAASWCIYAVLIFGRLQLGWRGQKAVRWTIGGFTALMMGYFGSKFVLEILLQ